MSGYIYTPSSGEPVGNNNPLPMQQVSVNPTQVSVTIANSASLSPAFDLQGKTLVGIHMPSAWTAANFTFQVSEDGITYDDLYDNLGTEKNITVAASRYIYLSPSDWVGVRFIKVRSGTAATPVAQGAARTIQLITKAV